MSKPQGAPTVQWESAEGITYPEETRCARYPRVKRNRSLTPEKGPNGARTEWYG